MVRESEACHTSGMKNLDGDDLQVETGDRVRRAVEGRRFEERAEDRPVAELVPLRRRRWVPEESVRQMLSTPTDPDLLEDLKSFESRIVTTDWWPEA